MRQNSKVGAVAIVGGTHGNELTGVAIVNHWSTNQLQLNYPEFQIELLVANPQALEHNKRYLQHDLNRCFKAVELNDLRKTSSEQILAKQINQQLGPKGNSRVDFIIDLHTSTANMQTNIVLIKMDAFHLKMAAYIQSVIPEAVITSDSQLMQDHHFLSSIAPKNLLIEIGPIAQGSLDYNVFCKTQKALQAALDFVKLDNLNQLPKLDDHLIVMSYFNKLYFPTDAQGNICAVVHPSLVHQDFSKIRKGMPVFKDFFGNDIAYQGEDSHIAFVNEAAYYDQKIAMCLCNPLTYSLTSLQPI